MAKPRCGRWGRGCVNTKEWMGDTVGCPGSQATAGDEARCLVRGEVPRDSEDTRVEVAELLEERRAHVYARRESDIFSGSMGAGDSVPMSLAPQPGHSSRTVAVAVLPLAVFLILTFCSCEVISHCSEDANIEGY